jgi:anaerobic selenocysteine-containing dehydrogenase
MSPHSNLAEHLIECLNVVCGRYARAGDVVPNPGVIGSRKTGVAEVIAPRRSWECSPKSRVRGLGSIFGEMMSATLPEEITQPGPGQVRALFVDGGNPANCIPDQARTVAALRELELLVCIEPFMTNTARLAHFVIPPKLMFERYDLPTRDYETIVTGRPYAQYAVPVAQPPPGSEVVDDWYVFWALAQRLGKQIHFDGVPLEMRQPPHTEDLLAILARNADVPFERLRRATAGEIFRVEPMTVVPGDPWSTARFDVMPADVRDELAAVRAETVEVTGFPYRLIVRRMREVQNTMYRHLPGIRRRARFNPLWLHPTDLATLGISSGSTVEIRSSAGCIRAIVEADSSLRPGVAAMSHGWGDLPEGTADFERVGSNTGRLIDTSGELDPINAMPRMSAIPINIQPL